MWCVTRVDIWYMLPVKWPLTTRHFPFSGRHLGVPVDEILSLNISFRSRTIFRKSHKHTPLYISRFQRYAGESDLGGNFTPPPLDIEGLNCSHNVLILLRRWYQRRTWHPMMSRCRVWSVAGCKALRHAHCMARFNCLAHVIRWRNNSRSTKPVISVRSYWSTKSPNRQTRDEIANANFLYDDIVHVLQNTIDSCINYATDRRGYVLQRMFTKFSEITQYNGHHVVQGHSRSPILVPIENSYDFLLVINTNLPPILHRFQVMADYSSNFR